MAAESTSKQLLPQDKYKEKFMKNANELREQNILCDVVLKVQESEFSAHRSILASGSSFFRGLFTNEMREKTDSEVALNQLESRTFVDVLQYIYTGEISVNHENARDLITAADYLLIPSLKEVGEKFLQTVLDVTNCFSVYAFAEKYCCKSLESAAKDYVCDHFLAAFTSKEFGMLDVTALKRIISSDDIFVYREEQVYEAVLEWINFDFENRKKHFEELFSGVRLFSMSKFYLRDYVETEALVIESASCNKMLFEAMKSFAFPDYRMEQLLNGQWKLRKWLEKEVNAIVITGGTALTERTKNTECYVPEHNTWYGLSDMLFQRDEHTSVVFENFLYCIGGYRENQTAERYDPRTNSWARIADMPSRCSSACTAVADGEIYVLGGSDGFRSTKNTMCYNPASNTWIYRKPLFTPRKAAATAVLDGYIYVLGGSNNESGTLNSVESYDPGADVWRKEVPMHNARMHASATVVNRKIFVIGGYQGEGTEPLCYCEVYDPDTFSWSFLPTMNIPRAAAGVTRIGRKIYVFGGNNESGSLATAESLDIADESETRQWQLQSAMPKPRAWFQCNVLRLPREVLTVKKRSGEELCYNLPHLPYTHPH